jgi:hypothetical protein
MVESLGDASIRAGPVRRQSNGKISISKSDDRRQDLARAVFCRAPRRMFFGMMLFFRFSAWSQDCTGAVRLLGISVNLAGVGVIGLLHIVLCQQGGPKKAEMRVIPVESMIQIPVITLDPNPVLDQWRNASIFQAFLVRPRP